MKLGSLENDPVYVQFLAAAPVLEPDDDGTPVDRRGLALALWLLRQRLLNLEANCEFAPDQGGPVGYVIPARLKVADAQDWERFESSVRAVADSMLAKNFRYQAQTVAQEIALHSALAAVEAELTGSDWVPASGIPTDIEFDLDQLLFDVGLVAGFVLDDADTFEHFDPMLDGSGPPLSEWFTLFDDVKT